ncbi:hypothetical protein LOK49_LG11G00673 [Camellia lanceoleosa]|uniref:Uncharacterized protein n=1 Tax=Camellia lanceoleosa TaxID=1840588 RepID=A0ACC0G4D3_9ERIC|nr:hypothetical protein LOK49_LG11G00673 [Camellia lanceoleosa]
MEGWKEASPMINPKSEAKVVALRGKLYVFGGGSDCGGDWVEHSIVAYEYDVAHNSWLDFKFNPFLFTLSQPVVVGNMLYCVDHELNAYNLDNKMLFSGPIEDLQIDHHLRCGDYLFTSSLLHLAEDRFCLLRVFPVGSQSCLHCTILQVAKGNDINGKGCLSTSVLSLTACCRNAVSISFVSWPMDYFIECSLRYYVTLMISKSNA